MLARVASCCLAAGLSAGCLFQQDLGKNSGENLNGTGGAAGASGSGGSSASGGTGSGGTGSAGSGGMGAAGSGGTGAGGSGGTGAGGSGGTGAGGSGGTGGGACPFEMPFLSPPTTLVTGQSNPDALAVDATSVYWVNRSLSFTNDGSLMKVSKAGGQPQSLASVAMYPTLPDDAFDGVIGLVVSATHAYWRAAQGHQVWRVPLAGGQPEPIYQGGPAQATSDFLTGSNAVHNIAVDGTHVYWTHYTTSTDQAVYAAPLGGGSAAPIAGSATSLQPAAVVANGTGVYWATYGSYQMGFLDGAVMGADPGGGNVHVVASSFGNTEWLAADATSLYATGWALNKARKIDLLAATPPEELNPAAGSCRSIAVDDVNAYVTVDYAENCRGILRMSKIPNNDVPMPLRMAADFHAYTIALDDQDLYWLDNYAGAISKMKK